MKNLRAAMVCAYRVFVAVLRGWDPQRITDALPKSWDKNAWKVGEPVAATAESVVVAPPQPKAKIRTARMARPRDENVRALRRQRRADD